MGGWRMPWAPTARRQRRLAASHAAHPGQCGSGLAPISEHGRVRGALCRTCSSGWTCRRAITTPGEPPTTSSSPTCSGMPALCAAIPGSPRSASAAASSAARQAGAPRDNHGQAGQRGNGNRGPADRRSGGVRQPVPSAPAMAAPDAAHRGRAARIPAQPVRVQSDPVPIPGMRARRSGLHPRRAGQARRASRLIPRAAAAWPASPARQPCRLSYGPPWPGYQAMALTAGRPVPAPGADATSRRVAARPSQPPKARWLTAPGAAESPPVPPQRAAHAQALAGSNPARVPERPLACQGCAPR
jgi:hypothetical protein